MQLIYIEMVPIISNVHRRRTEQNFTMVIKMVILSNVIKSELFSSSCEYNVVILRFKTWYTCRHVDGLAQECGNAIVNALIHFS